MLLKKIQQSKIKHSIHDYNLKKFDKKIKLTKNFNQIYTNIYYLNENTYIEKIQNLSELVNGQ